MAQLQSIEGQIELKCHADKFFDVCAHKPYLISQMTDKIPKIELHEGKWHEVGSVMIWNYVFAGLGEQSFVKLRTEDINEEKRLVRHNLLEDGFVMKNYYKSSNNNIQVIPKGEGCIVKWTIEYEKMNENAPEPNKYLDYLMRACKDIGDALCNA